MRRRSLLSIPALSASRILGANDRIRLGLIGCGARGRYVANFIAKQPGTQYLAAADAYLPHADQAREWMGPEAKAFQDFRRLLEMKEIDAVHVATPDHWHAIPTILACQAGKDVYVEKPVAHDVREGQAMLRAARRYKRMVHVGTQHRSAEHFREVQYLLQSGELGEIRFVRVWNYSNYSLSNIRPLPDSEPPAGLDWDLYLGPAPKVPFNQHRFLGTYRWFSDYSGGYITDFGVHRLDTVQQVMGVQAPVRISAVGGRFLKNFPGDVPDLLQVTFDYDGFVVSYESMNLNGHGTGGRTPGQKYYGARGEFDRPNGMAFYGTNGTLIADRVGFEVFPEPLSADDPTPRIPPRRRNVADATEAHARRFIECIRFDQPSPADIEIAHRSTTVAHLGNIAYRTGQKLEWDAVREEFTGNPAANKLLARAARKPWDLVA